MAAAATPARDATGAARARIITPRALTLTIPPAAGRHASKQQVAPGSPPASPAKHPPPLFDGSMQGGKPARPAHQQQQLQQAEGEAGAAKEGWELLHAGSNMQELKQLHSGLLRYPASDASQNMAALVAAEGNGNGNGAHFSFPALPAGNKRQQRGSPGSAAAPWRAGPEQQQQQEGGPSRAAGGHPGAQEGEEEQAGPRFSLRATKRRRTLQFADGEGAAGADVAAGGSGSGSPEVDDPAAAAAAAGGGSAAAAALAEGEDGERRRTPMWLMATMALRQLPGQRGSLAQVATLIKHNAAFAGELDSSPRPGTRVRASCRRLGLPACLPAYLPALKHMPGCGEEDATAARVGR